MGIDFERAIKPLMTKADSLLYPETGKVSVMRRKLTHAPFITRKRVATIGASIFTN